METDTTSGKAKELMDELPSDPDELKRIIRVIIEDDVASARQQEEALAAMKVLVSSWRWRIGDAVVSSIRSLLNRKRVRLPTDHVLSRLNALVRKSHDRETLGISYIDYRNASELQFYRGSGAKRVYTKKRVEELELFLSLQENLDFPHCVQPSVSIVLVLYNRAELTYACLSSILKSVHVPYQLIIVDNASSDNSADLLEKVDGATILVNSTNEGFLKACNLAAEHADGKYLLFLNNDAVLVGDAVSQAIAVFDEERGIGGVGGKISIPNKVCGDRAELYQKKIKQHPEQDQKRSLSSQPGIIHHGKSLRRTADQGECVAEYTLAPPLIATKAQARSTAMD